jgi:integrase
MRIRNDVSIQKEEKRDRWLVRWWGKYDVRAEKQPRFCKSFKLKRHAEKFAESIKNDRDDGISIEPKTITLGNLCEKALKTIQSTIEDTSLTLYQETVQKLIDYFGAHKNIKTINKEVAEQFLSDIRLCRYEGKVTPADSTRARHLRNAKLIFNRAVDWDYIRKNPFKGISLGKAKVEKWYYITPPEYRALIQVLDSILIRKNKRSNITEKQDIFNKVMLKAFYCVMYGCGLRFGEAANLMWSENIDFKKSTIRIVNRNSKDGMPPFTLKDYEERSIDAPVWVMSSLKELKEISDSPYVFLSGERYKCIQNKWKRMVAAGKAHKWLNSMMIMNTHRKFNQYCILAGIKTSDRLSVHGLRKAYGTNLANLNTPVHTLKALMGHSNIQTTMEYYIFSSDENKKKAVEGLNGILGEQG